MYKIIRIILLLLLAGVCLYLYFYIDNSQEIKETIDKTNRHKPDGALFLLAFIGLGKLFFILTAITIPVSLVFHAVREKLGY